MTVSWLRQMHQVLTETDWITTQWRLLNNKITKSASTLYYIITKSESSHFWSTDRHRYQLNHQIKAVVTYRGNSRLWVFMFGLWKYDFVNWFCINNSVFQKKMHKVYATQFCNHTEPCGFQQNVQKEIVNTIKASVWIQPLNILCFAAGKWTIWK